MISGSALGDRLKADREFGQQALRNIGMGTAASHGFTSYQESIAFLKRQPGRYVLKFNGANMPHTRNYIGQVDDGTDLLALMEMNLHHAAKRDKPDFLLMPYVQRCGSRGWCLLQWRPVPGGRVH